MKFIPVTSAGFDWAAPRFIPIQAKVSESSVRLAAGGEAITLQGNLFSVESDEEVISCWNKEEREYLVFSLQLHAERSTWIRKVNWFSGNWDACDKLLVHRTGLQDNFLFIRKGRISFFLSVDFPSTKITEDGLGYEPWDHVSAGTIYDCHTISVGACILSGCNVGNYDRSEVEAASSYVETRFPLRFQRPVFGTTCITNRMTDVREGRIFYSMHDNPTLLLAPDVLKEEIDLCAEAGMEYYQIFEGIFDWPKDDTAMGEQLTKLVAYAAERGVRVGDYVHPGELYCPHYNYERRFMDREEWRQLNEHGERGQLCLGCEPYADFLIERVRNHNETFGEQMICLDMLDIQPCYDTAHHHPAGDVYSQIRGLIRFMDTLAALHPDYLIWTNSGNWLEFMPKLVWHNPNIYLTDPHVRNYSPNLNMLKLMGDTRREQMVTIHNTYFVPYRFYSNCEYYYVKRSRVHDVHYFEYSLLQSLAVTPNLFLGEWRTFLDRIPSSHRERCVAFVKKWMDFIKTNYIAWSHTKQVGESPAVGAVEAYSHIDGTHGFLCLVNQNPFPGSIRVKLDGSIGLQEKTDYDLFEIYPKACPIAEQPLPYAPYGESILLTIPPQSVRYIEIKPHEATDGCKVVGWPSQVIKTEQGYRISLQAPQGESISIGLQVPVGQTISGITARQAPHVPMFTFASSAAIVRKQGNMAVIRVNVPREKAPRSLTRWRLQPGDVELELPQAGSCGFLGGLVTGAYSETISVWLDVEIRPWTGEEDHIPFRIVDGASTPPEIAAVPKAQKQTFETIFTLPFLEWEAFMPGIGDDAVIELSFINPNHVKEISARLNGKSVEVRRYAYATKQEWYTYYIELAGNAAIGEIQLQVSIEWVEAYLADAQPLRGS